jgi:hypothetical protein
MAAPVALRSLYSHFFGTGALPVLEEIFRTRMGMHPSRRSLLFVEKQTDRDIWQSTELHDMELFAQIAEGEEYSYKRLKQGASKSFTIKKMGLGFSISRESIEDGKVDLVGDMTALLADSAMESKEVDAMNVFNNGAGSETTADAVSVFNSAHTLPSGQTFSNVLATAADLSETSFKQAITEFRTNFIGDSGIKKLIEPKILLVPDTNRLYAKELVGSELKPDSADNNMNSLKGEGIMVVSSPHLTDTDSWFLIGPKTPDKNGLRVINRQSIQTKSEEDFDRDAIRYKASYRERLGAIHPYGLFGCYGA